MHMVVKNELSIPALKLFACSQHIIVLVTLFIAFYICRCEFDICKLCRKCCSRLWCD